MEIGLENWIYICHKLGSDEFFAWVLSRRIIACVLFIRMILTLSIPSPAPRSVCEASSSSIFDSLSLTTTIPCHILALSLSDRINNIVTVTDGVHDLVLRRCARVMLFGDTGTVPFGRIDRVYVFQQVDGVLWYWTSPRRLIWYTLTFYVFLTVVIPRACLWLNRTGHPPGGCKVCSLPLDLGSMSCRLSHGGPLRRLCYLYLTVMILLIFRWNWRFCFCVYLWRPKFEIPTSKVQMTLVTMKEKSTTPLRYTKL